MKHSKINASHDTKNYTVKTAKKMSLKEIKTQTTRVGSHVPAVPVSERQKQEYHKFEGSLHYKGKFWPSLEYTERSSVTRGR